jgi:predicted PurR-regulated permease PerM
MAAMPGGAPKLQIPRWIQLVGLPVLLLFTWTVAGAVRQVIFLFLVAALIALLLNPIVRTLQKIWIPRGFGVAIVYLVFAVLVLAASVGVATVLVTQTKTASHRIDNYFTKQHGHHQTSADQDIDRLQHWLDHHKLKRIHLRKIGHDFVNNIKGKDVQKYTTRAINFVEGAAIGTIKLLFSLILIVVVSIYMLLDMQRLSSAIDRRFPPRPDSPALMVRIERSLVGYVRGQLLISLIISVSAGTGLWLLGTLGWTPNTQRYALLFGGWVFFAELIPYVGPVLGAAPPVLYELVVHPIGAVWVILLFLLIQQVEGHIVVPNVMGSALQLHPLLVIFGLLAGGEIYGLAGALLALPLLAIFRAIWEFFAERVALESWQQGGAVPVEVEVEPSAPRPVAPVKPPDPPAAAQR